MHRSLRNLNIPAESIDFGDEGGGDRIPTNDSAQQQLSKINSTATTANNLPVTSPGYATSNFSEIPASEEQQILPPPNYGSEIGENNSYTSKSRSRLNSENSQQHQQPQKIVSSNNLFYNQSSNTANHHQSSHAQSVEKTIFL